MSLLVLDAGCGAANASHGPAGELAELREQITELQRANAAHQSKIEELNHWLFLLQDKVDSNRVSLTRRDAKPELKVVKLQPPEPAAVKPKPARAKAAPAPQPTAEPEPVVGGSARETDTAPPEPAAAGAGQGGGAEPVMLSNRPAADGSAPTVRTRAERVARNQAAVQAYQEAYGLLEQGEVNQAVLRFSRFVEDFGDSDLADNALYWTGEAYYDQKEYALALAEFQRVVSEYPEGNKVPDALLKSALCLTELKDQTRARNALYQLVDLYPSSEAARVAQQRLGDSR